jgi:hypothetical protein
MSEIGLFALVVAQALYFDDNAITKGVERLCPGIVVLGDIPTSWIRFVS